ncbi:MAG: DUF2927 domain-containing protein [Pseudomonadota bacterium]
MSRTLKLSDCGITVDTIWQMSRRLLAACSRILAVALIACLPILVAAEPQTLARHASLHASEGFSDTALINGFYRTVFGLEHDGGGIGANIVKKFSGPVRLYVDDRSEARRGLTVEQFAGTLESIVSGLDLEVVDDPVNANFTVYVVGRSAYAQTIRDDVYASPEAPIRGRCMVRVITLVSGINRAQAVIVADEGDFLFTRCMIEEILQGLGPLNDDSTLAASVFNDTSTHTVFTLYDRYLLNMLYHPHIKAGMTRKEVDLVINAVLDDVRQTVR